MAYRILTLDGGGAWAILEAMALKEIFGDIDGLQILKKFDLVASNSGGSIVLGALIAGYKPSRVIDFFLSDSERDKIFAKLPWWKKIPSSVIGVGARYSTEGKRNGIASFLGAPLANTAMKDLAGALGSTKIFIMGFDYDWLRAEFYRSHDNLAGSKASAIALADAINASSTAPVNYFDEPAKANDTRRHWDGGLGGYNNPILAAVVEARIAGIAPDQISALSIGTGTVRLLRKDHPGSAPDKYVESWKEPASLKRDIMKVATCILGDPPDAASYTSYIMLGNSPRPPTESGSGNIVRLNPMVQPCYDSTKDCWGPPPGLSEGEFDALIAMDSDAAAPGDVAKVHKLGQAWMNPALNYPNQPIRMGLPKMDCEVGDPTFAAGLARWRAISKPPKVPST